MPMRHYWSRAFIPNPGMPNPDPGATGLWWIPPDVPLNSNMCPNHYHECRYCHALIAPGETEYYTVPVNHIEHPICWHCAISIAVFHGRIPKHTEHLYPCYGEGKNIE